MLVNWIIPILTIYLLFGLAVFFVVWFSKAPIRWVGKKKPSYTVQVLVLFIHCVFLWPFIRLSND
jgi:hypothetical protein